MPKSKRKVKKSAPKRLTPVKKVQKSNKVDKTAAVVLGVIFLALIAYYFMQM